ncbi:MAG: hypothetical protein HC852_12965 [Acaryochloridaceae cyanobacterium RU_4_10]|nr:hypothetical protein [Acaryochloridaceae cyanobacterium RU_4_10]
MRNLDFLWLVLLSWLVAILTIQTNGWVFIFHTNNYVGFLLGSLVSICLAGLGGWRSLQTTRRHPKILGWGVCALASLLIVLVVGWNVAASSGV